MRPANAPVRSVVRRLVAKDLYFFRWLIVGTLVTGVASLALSSLVGGDPQKSGPNVGILIFMTTVIAFGIFVAMFGILKERQDKSQLFVLSLPVSPAQYSFAKTCAALVAFLAPWGALTAGVFAVTALSGEPMGGMPFFVVMMTFFLCNFCILLALVVISKSELVAVAGILVTNLSVTLFLVQVGRLPGVAEHSAGEFAVWSPTILAVLAIEIAVIALALGLALWFPSRKKDFV